MSNFSIVRIGKDYVVQADDKSVLKISSRRMAAKLVTDAAELLLAQDAAGRSAEPSSARDSNAIASRFEVP